MTAPDPSTYTVVVPTLGRASLAALLRALSSQESPLTARVLLVDDRRGAPAPLDLRHADGLDLRVLRAGGGGPARARNIGWRHTRTPWVVFLDDDVEPSSDWADALADDLRAAEEGAAEGGVVGTTGRIEVPLASGRRPTDWERGTRGLETARWITADIAYRRDALASVGGFDERFPRAFREDADLALRLGGHLGRIRPGRRRTVHPVRPVGDWASLRQQAGNADDFLMRAVHGRGWEARAGAPVGRRTRHVVVTASGVVAVLAAASGRSRLATAATVAWLMGTGEFVRARVAPGPRDRREVRRMLLTSVTIPPAAVWHSLRGALAHRHAAPWRGLPDLVLFDRDGTLVHDVPYNGQPARVRPVDDARESLDRLRALGVRVGLVTNQSGIARGVLTTRQVTAVNGRIERLLGPFDTVQVCPHGPGDGCDCRKPAPGMIKQACAELAVDPARTVVIGDIAADVAAAEAAGATGVLVPTAATRAEEVATAARCACTLSDAVDRLVAGQW